MATEPLFGDDTGPKRAVGAPPEVGMLDPRVAWILKNVTRAEPKVNEWRDNARDCYRFIAGKQYKDEDERSLNEQQRPANVFNTVAKFFNYVSGVQRDSPIAVLFNAVDLENTQAQLFGDRVTKYYEWALLKAFANDERARGFGDMLTGGMGWTEGFITRALDPRGLIGLPRISPFEMLWPESDRINLGSSGEGCPRWLARETYIENEEAKALFPDDYAHALIDASGSDSAPVQTWPSVDSVRYKIPYVQTYPLDQLSGRKGDKKDKSKIMQFQWWDNQIGYVFEDPLDNTEQFMTVDEFHEYSDQLDGMFGAKIENFDRQIGRKWMKAFLLNRRFLLEDPTPLPGNRFTYNCMCCHWDEAERRWYGFIRVLIDPQRYANKFFNQMIETMAKQAKAGALAEVSAFEDKAQEKDFLDTYSQTGSVNLVAPDAIKEGRIKEKGLPQTPQAAMAILSFLIDSMGKYLTGLSEDSLGLGASTGAAVAVKRRQRAGMVLLAAEFDSEAQFRTQEGYIVYDYLKLISDNRLIRVGGAYQGEIVKLEGAPFSLEYEITLDEVERDPNTKQWMAEMLMGPFGQTLANRGLFIDEFWNYLPIPRRDIEKIKQRIQAQQQKAQQDAAMGLPVQGGRGQKKSLMELRALVENKNADTMMKLAKAQALSGKGKLDESKMIMEALRAQQEEQRMQRESGMNQAKGIMDMAKTANDMLNPPDQGGGQPPH